MRYLRVIDVFGRTERAIMAELRCLPFYDALVATRRDDLELDTVEGLWLEIAAPKSRSFLVGNFYRPDRTSPYYDKDFMVKLNGILDTASAEGKGVLLFGDFNCCFMSSHRNDSDCKQLKSLFRSLNIKQLIDQRTRITKNSRSLTDLVAVNCPHNVCESEVVSAHLSDHELVYRFRKFNWKRAPLKSRPSEIIMCISKLTLFVKP